MVKRLKADGSIEFRRTEYGLVGALLVYSVGYMAWSSFELPIYAAYPLASCCIVFSLGFLAVSAVLGDRRKTLSWYPGVALVIQAVLALAYVDIGYRIALPATSSAGQMAIGVGLVVQIATMAALSKNKKTPEEPKSSSYRQYVSQDFHMETVAASVGSDLLPGWDRVRKTGGAQGCFLRAVYWSGPAIGMSLPSILGKDAARALAGTLFLFVGGYILLVKVLGLVGLIQTTTSDS
jgi:hypothetical protein